jgi:hypothetical protein
MNSPELLMANLVGLGDHHKSSLEDFIKGSNRTIHSITQPLVKTPI